MGSLAKEDAFDSGKVLQCSPGTELCSEKITTAGVAHSNLNKYKWENVIGAPPPITMDSFG